MTTTTTITTEELQQAAKFQAALDQLLDDHLDLRSAVVADILIDTAMRIA